MTTDHRAEAERLLGWCRCQEASADALWAQAAATRALAHAVLALGALPESVPAAVAMLEADDPSAGRTPAADELPEIIVYRGDKVDDWRTAPTQLRKSEPFTLRDQRNLMEHLHDD